MRAESTQFRVLRGTALLLVVLLTGCGDGETSSESGETRRARTAGPPVVIEAGVDEATVDIGDRVLYSVEVRWEPGHEVDLPPVLEQFENWLIHDPGDWVDLPKSGTKVGRRIEVTLDPGIGPVLTIPATTLRWREEGAAGWEEIVTEEITVEVVSVTEGAPEFREPEDFFELPEPAATAARRDRTAILIGTGVAVAVIGALALFLFRRRKERKAPTLPAHEIAQRELAHLDSLGLVAEGRVKEYYYRLTGILRRYIEMRFGIMAPEQTTEEFLAVARTSDALPAGQQDALSEFLAAADLVKYARHEPGTEDCRRAYDTAERFVKVTIPAPRVSAEREEAAHAV